MERWRDGELVNAARGLNSGKTIYQTPKRKDLDEFTARMEGGGVTYHVRIRVDGVDRRKVFVGWKLNEVEHINYSKK